MAMFALSAPRSFAQPPAPAAPVPGQAGAAAPAEASHGVFEPEHGTWFNSIARNLFSTSEEKEEMKASEARIAMLKAMPEGSRTPAQEKELEEGVHYVKKYDFLLYTPLLWILLAVTLVGAARKMKVRPEGKPASSANLAEAALAGFQDYLIGVMGNDLARKYTPLIASFFFTILVSNWIGLIPGMTAVSAQPAIPIALALVAFISVHIIAIKEAGFKSWFMHFVGEPIWLAPLNFPLHIVGELIKPLSLSLRLLCNVFGEEAVIATLVGLAIAFLPVWLPIPFQIPMLLLGTFFGFLQALVFSTLLAIYVSIFATHHDEHGHEHVEHAVDSNGHHHIVAHPTEATVGA